MEWQRVVEVYSGQPQGSRGSGYLLAGNLILSACHVVEGFNEVDVRLLEADALGLPGGVGPWQRARVAWTGEHADLALLSPVDRSATFRSLATTVSVARLDGRAPVKVHALGFPRAMLTPAHSDTLFLEATVNAWTGVRGESLLLNVQTPRPSDPDGWKGMSGAAVFAADRLVGVIEAVPAKLDSATLRAAAAHALFEDAGAAALLRDSQVEYFEQFVDAAYVDSLPAAGHWHGIREQYARAVVGKLCTVDYLGLAVSGAPDRRTAALSVFADRQMRVWPSEFATTR